jgi:hypothetical protein
MRVAFFASPAAATRGKSPARQAQELDTVSFLQRGRRAAGGGRKAALQFGRRPPKLASRLLTIKSSAASFLDDGVDGR